jgi:hypothetical protein
MCLFAFLSVRGMFIDNGMPFPSQKPLLPPIQRDKQEVYNGPIMSSKVVSDGGKVIALERRRRSTHKKACAKSPATKSHAPSLGRANLVLIDVTLSTHGAKYRLARCWSENVNK